MSDQQQPLVDDTKSQQPQNPPSHHRPLVLEVKGVRLKHFERVLIKLLQAHVEPRYIPLPSPSFMGVSIWDTLPPAARVYGSLPGQLSNRERATRKEDQLTSMMRCIFAILSPPSNKTATIVDFGGGSGHLSIPLALLLPHCKIVVVDLKQKSLGFLQVKARECAKQKQRTNISDTDNNPPNSFQEKENSTPCNDIGQQTLHTLPTAIPNLFTFTGDVESYADTFNMGVALHVCGEATDVVIRKCAFHKAHMVVAPCCVGKLNRQVKDPYIYRATSHNTPTIHYPQSKRFQQCLPVLTQVDNNHITTTNHGTSKNNHRTDMNDWDALAKAADYNQELDLLMNNNNNNQHRRNAARRTAKGLLELDRQLFLQESYPVYQTALTRMQPLTASPKHDILMGYYSCKSETPEWLADHDAPIEDPVFAWTKAHLLHPGASAESVTSTMNGTKDTTTSASTIGSSVDTQPKHVLSAVEPQTNQMGSSPSSTQDSNKADGVDWTWNEEQEIRTQLTARFPPSEASTPSLDHHHHETKPQSNNTVITDGTFVFPPGMGGRKRKIIHFVAEELGLAHWCVGKKHAEKTVAVRRKFVKGKISMNE